jgi:hypothetical protein
MGRRSGTLRLLAVTVITLVVLSSAACQEAPQTAESPLPATQSPLLPTRSPLPPTDTVAPLSPTLEAETQEREMPTVPTPNASPTGTESEGIVTLATAGLAQRLDVPEEKITVESVEVVQWPDAGLGCPQPGMIYAQVITPGYRVLLEVDGQAYEIHTDTGQAMVLCEWEGPATIIPPVSGTAEPEPEPLITLAKEDLVQRLSISEGEIDIVEAKAIVWPDAGLGCPQPGMAYAQAITPGYRIVLAVGDQIYEYHTDRGRIVVLCADSSPPGLDAPGGSQLSIFVEIVQTPLSPDPPSRMPPKDTSPIGVFAFDPAGRLLLVQPSVEILPTTQVLVGLTTAGVPGRPYFASELFQLPSQQTTPLSLIAIDADSGTLTLAYAGQFFELSPGESRSFKQKAEGDLSPLDLTTITNHGPLAAIGLLPPDPAGP